MDLHSDSDGDDIEYLPPVKGTHDHEASGLDSTSLVSTPPPPPVTAATSSQPLELFAFLQRLVEGQQ